MMTALAMLLFLQWMPDAETCADTSYLPQQGLNACAAWDFEQADRELNETWDEVLAYVRETLGDEPEWDDRGSGEEHLIAAQRAWITLRDEHCTVMGFHMRAGSAEPMLYNGCRAGMTRNRTEELRALMIED